MRQGKTGGQGGVWVELEQPKPPRVADVYQWWGAPPPERSARCAYWLRQIEAGWLPNGHIARMGREGAHWYGVWMWEWTNEIGPAISRSTAGTRRTCGERFP